MSYNSKELKVRYHKGDKPSKKFNNRNPRPGNSGQWTNPGVPTEIQSRHITMRYVQDPVKGVDNFGNEQIMLPGMDYVFPGSVVTEYPLAKAQKGGSSRWLDEYQTGREVQPIKVTDPNDPRLKAYNDSLSMYNFSNKRIEAIKKDPTKKGLGYVPFLSDELAGPKLPGIIPTHLYEYIDYNNPVPVGNLAISSFKKPVQPYELVKLQTTTKAPMLDSSTNLSMDILDDGRGKNVSMPIDRIMMPSGEEVSRSEFIKQYGEAAWQRATNQQLQYGGDTDPALFKPQLKSVLDTYTKAPKKEKVSNINPMTGKPWATGAIEESISPLDLIQFASAAGKLPGVIKSLIPKKLPPKSVVNVFPEEFAKKYSELGTYVTDVKPNKWLYPPDEYLGRKQGGSKLPTHLPEAYKTGGWLKKYK